MQECTKKSIVKAESLTKDPIIGDTLIEAILQVQDVDGFLKVDNAVIAIDGGDFKKSNKIKILEVHEAVLITTGDEFDSIYDVIGRELFK